VGRVVGGVDGRVGRVEFVEVLADRGPRPAAVERAVERLYPLRPLRLQLLGNRRDADAVLSQHLGRDTLRQFLRGVRSVEEAQVGVGVHVDEPRSEIRTAEVDHAVSSRRFVVDASDPAVVDQYVRSERVPAGPVENAGVPELQRRRASRGHISSLVDRRFRSFGRADRVAGSCAAARAVTARNVEGSSAGG